MEKDRARGLEEPCSGCFIVGANNMFCLGAVILESDDLTLSFSKQTGLNEVARKVIHTDL